MRHVFIILFALGLSSGIQAQISHDLEIYSESGIKFFLTLNGRLMNEVPQSSIQIVNTDKDYLHVNIRFEDPALPEIDRKMLQIAEPGTQEKVPVSTVYKIVEKKGEYKLTFASRSQKKIQEQPTVIIHSNEPQISNGRIMISW